MVVLALGLGACSETDGSTKNAYVRQLNAGQARLTRAASEASGAITDASSVRQDRRTLVRYGAVLGGLVRTLRGVEVPEHARPEHARLIAALAAFRKEISSIVIQLRSSTTRAIDDADHRLADATKTFNASRGEALRAIDKKLQAG
jgi:hypothetical protein